MSVVVFAASVAPWFLFGLDGVLQPGRFDSTAAFNVYAVLVGMVGAVLGLRTFIVAPRDGVVEFRMHLRMSGPLAPLILESVGDRQPEIDTFSAALRAHVEVTCSAGPRHASQEL